MPKSRTTNPATTVSLSDVQRIVDKALAASQKKSVAKRPNNQGPRSDAINASFSASGTGSVTQGRGAGGVLVRNSEYVTDLSTSSGSFSSFDVNPNSSALFAWLSGIATKYELFRFKSLEVVYTPICPSTTTGVVVMAFDYDASDAAPTTKQLLSGYQGSVRGNVWNELVIRLSPPSGWFYIGSSPNIPNPAGTDVKFYTPARLHVGMFNGGLNIPAGELTVKYAVEFAKPDFTVVPVIEPNAGQLIMFTAPTLADIANGPISNGTIPVSIASNGTGSYRLNFTAPGDYLIEQCARLTAATAQGDGWLMPQQTDPGQSVFSVPVGDFIASQWANGSTLFNTIHMYAVRVLAGTYIAFTVMPSITGGGLFRIRIGRYQKTLS